MRAVKPLARRVADLKTPWVMGDSKEQPEKCRPSNVICTVCGMRMYATSESFHSIELESAAVDVTGDGRGYMTIRPSHAGHVTPA